MQWERRGHTLQPTALANEAWIHLSENPRWKDVDDFRPLAAQIIRRILIDYARQRGTQKRGRDWKRVEVDQVTPIDGVEISGIDLLALDDALTKLEIRNEELARVVELRFFAGLTVPEVAEVMKASPRTIENRWRIARALLYEWMR